MEHRPLGWEQIADSGAMRVVGLRLAAGQRVPEHRNALPLAIIVTEGVLRYSEGAKAGETAGQARAGELILINPGERHTYWADEETAAYMVFAGLPGVRARPWSLRKR
jgi:quercetin dioxygenase-like cupin family protein